MLMTKKHYRGEKLLFGSQFYVIVRHFEEVKACSQAASHVISTVKNKTEPMHLPFSDQLVLLICVQNAGAVHWE